MEIPKAGWLFKLIEFIDIQGCTFSFIDRYAYSWYCSWEDKHLFSTWGCLNIKMSSYQYENSHYKYKTVSWPSYLYNGNNHIWKNRLYIDTGLRISVASYHKISWRRETPRSGVETVVSLWNLTGTSTVLSRGLSNFRAIRQLQIHFSRLRDFARSGDKTSYC